MSLDPFRNCDASSITTDVVGVFVVLQGVMQLRRMYWSRVSCAARGALGEGSQHDRLIHRASGGGRRRHRRARVHVPAEVALLFLQKLRRRDGLLGLD